MKYSIWSLYRSIALCALLVGGSLSALAAPPVLTVPGTVTVGEDLSTNVPVGLTDSAVPVFTVTTTVSSSNTNLVSNTGLVLNGSGTNRTLLIAPGLHKSGSATITIIATDSQPSSTTNTFSLTVTPTNYPPVFISAINDLTRNQNAPATNLSFSISDIQSPASNLTVTATSSNTTLVPNNNLVFSGTGTNRTLTVTQATNQFGTTLIELIVTDSGGATATNDFVLTVWPVNQPPTFTMATNRLVYDENYGPVSNSSFITGVTSGPTNQSAETNYFVLTYTTNFYAQAPALDTNGNLTFQVATNMYGTNTITFVLINSGSLTNGGKNSLTNTLTLDVPFVNQAPSFSLSTNAVQINEETLVVTNVGFLTHLSAGPSNENNQTWSFALTTLTNSATNVVFTALPIITTNGTLIFHSAAHSYGTNWVTVVMTDSGGTNNGGVNTCSNAFQIEVAQTNHAPVIVVATNFTVFENNTNNLSATVNVWDYDTQSSNLTLTATSLNTNLASVTVPTNTVPSATNAVFTMAFAPVTNANGVATVRLVATEGNLSTTNTFTLTITSVNQAPSFTLSTNAVQINEETLAVTNVHFLTNISAGPPDESGQTWTFTTITTTNSPTNVAFTVLPAIATNGTLTFHPAAHSYGTNWVTVIMTDSGGTNNGGVNTSSNTFQIEVAQTNHAPVIVVSNNFTVLENYPNGTATVNVWDYDTQSSNLTLTATALNTNLASVSVPTNTVPSATNAVFTLAFTPKTNANGIVTVQLVATEGPLSTTNDITLTITAVNQAPSFTLSTNAVQINEETLAVTNVGFLTNISAGPTNENNQTWTFALNTATNSATNVVFTSLPIITTNGTLIFHPAAHSYGTNWVTVIMTDSGGTNNGGVNTCSNSFQIEVAQTNHAPVIVVATNFTVFENNTNNLSATVNVWDYDTQSSNLTLTATSLNTNLASVTVPTNTVPSATNAVFTMAFAPVTNANGVATVRLVATEGNLSTTNTFTLTITAVNQAPSFTLSTNAVQINEETLAVTNVHFLTNISAGPPDESAQTWTFTTITTTNSPTNVAFTVLPAIATNGTLTFHPAAHSYGTNWVTIIMTDSGGTNNGGVNTSSNTFQIEVAQTNHAPVIVVSNNFTVLENNTNGTATVNVWDYDTQSSNLTLTATALNTNLATVSVPTNTVPSATNAVFTLAFTPNTNANGIVTVQLVATEGPLSTTNNITLTITAVNQAPSFTLSTNAVQINEETLAVTNVGFLTNISAGPTNEKSQTWTFALTTATNSATNVVFTSLPVITTNGTLIFHPAAHSYGTNWVSVIMTDSGGTNNGGVNTCSNSFVIEVAQTNHAPVIVVATNFTVLENNTNNLTATVNVWDYDTQSSNLTLTATSLNTNLASVTVPTNTVPSATNAVFTLNFAPVTNANGVVTIRLVATEGPLSTTNNITLTITAVNQAPSFTLSTNAVQINEETLAVTNVHFLTNISAGPSNESAQTWTFTTITTTNSPTNVAFTVLPAIATNGTLTFHPAAHSYGTNWVTVIMTDSGGTNNGGINTSSNTFQIEVAQTNHAPVIVVSTNFTVLENNTNNLSSTVNVWDYDTQSSNLTLTATSLNTNLASVTVPTNTLPSATNAVFTMAFAPVTNANGVATVRLVATEGNLSTTNTFTLTITAVNQAPGFTLSTNAVQINEETLAVTNVGFLTNISAGPSNESSQTWTFAVTTATNNATNVVFTSLPVITTNGTLIFHPAAHSYGTNWVSVVMTDSGGTNNGGVNTCSNSFVIEVAQTNHAPVIVVATNFTVLENNTNNLTATVNVWDYDTQSSNLTLTATSLNTNLASVTVPTNTVPSATNAVFTIAFAPVTNANGVATVRLVATEGNLSTTNTFTLTVTAVNQAPSFTLSTNAVQINEETLAVTNVGFLTNISAGPTNENNQTWTFAVTTATNSATNVVFTSLPVITTNGTLIFHPAAHSYGTNWVSVIMTDSGGTNNGGVNTCSNSFVIEVAQTNHAPVIVVATNFTVLENNTNNLTATVNVWDYDTQSSNLTLTATSLNTNLASVTVPTNTVPSATNAVFTIAFAPVTNANGVATVRLVATEGNLSTTNTFTLTVTAVNQAPTFTLSTNAVQINEETLAVTNVGFLTNISAGPTNENNQTWTFAVTTVTNSATNVVFTSLPVITTNGTLIFHPAAHSYGTNWVSVVMTDSGGTNNGGVNTCSNSFVIEVAQTNHAPVIVVSTNFTVLENNTNNLTATVNVWDYDTQSSNLTLTATSLNTNLASVTVPTNTVPSATNAVFTIAFAPVTNANGVATVRLVATEGNLSTTNTFTLTVTAVNQAPSFTLSTNAVQINEETLAFTNLGFLTNISAGPTNENNQTWTFAVTTVTNSVTNVVFTSLPVITTNGTLIFHPAAHSYGTNWVSVIMTDSGGTNNGGVNTCSNGFVIEVAQTNHAPVIVVSTNFTVLENNTNNLSATVNVWDYDTQSSNLTLTATSLNTNLASVTVPTNTVPSATNAVFTMAFAPVTNANGVATVRLVATEGNLSTTNTFTLTVTAVNQAPSFTLSTNAVQINEETLAFTNLGFLTNISAGPTNENNQTWTFAVTTVTNSATNVVFTSLPIITTNGTLIFHPAAHSYGTNWVSVVMTDSGGTNNGGVNTCSNAFQIEVAQTNHAPVIVVATNFTVLENNTNNLTATVNVWDYDTQSSNLTLTATALNTNIASVTVPTNTVPSATNAVFTLNFAPVTNANGVVTIQLVATEGPLSTTNNITLTITAVNQAPTFTLSTNVMAAPENAGVVITNSFLTGISAGPSNESNQTWAFTIITPTNNATNVTFAQYPTISTNGTLTFATTTNAFGTNLVTVIMTDSGGTNNGGVNTYSNSFQLQVAQVFYAPIFIGLTNKTVLENATTNLSMAFTLYDHLGTNFNVSCLSSNTNLVTVSLTGAGSARTLVFAPITNANGDTTISLTADDGIMTNSTNITLTVLAVNQAPSFNLAITSVTVDKFDVAVSMAAAVTNISPGPTNESNQIVTFTLTNSSPSLFIVQPAIDTNGTLTFTPGGTGGTITVGVKAVDNGGTLNGGVNTSAVQTFTITIPANPFPYLTGPFAGLFFDTNNGVNASSGYFSLTLATNGSFNGYVLCAGNSNTFTGQFDISNSYAGVTASNYVLDLTIDTSANWTETVSGSVSNSVDGWSVSLQSYLIGYSASQPTALAGTYLMAMPGFADPTAGPAGDSVFSMIVSNGGEVSLTADMADDTIAKQVSQISFAGYYPLYVPLYDNGRSGSLVGWLTFTGVPSSAVSSTSTLTWFNDPGAITLYANGFTNQAVPTASLYNSTLGNVLTITTGTVVLSGGGLSDSITNAVTISGNTITVDPSATNGLSLTVAAASGEVIGTFVNGDRTNSIQSAILQNSTNAAASGYFIGPSQGGSFNLFGN